MDCYDKCKVSLLESVGGVSRSDAPGAGGVHLFSYQLVAGLSILFILIRKVITLINNVWKAKLDSRRR